MNRIACLITAALMLATAAPAMAEDYRLGSLEILSPWIRATPPAARTAGGFLTIHNSGDMPDRLIAVASPLGEVEIHTMEMADGVMKMRHLPDGLEVPAGATVVLKPGSHHLMFLDLAAPVAEGDHVAATLTFDRAGEVAVVLQVAPIGARGPAAHAAGRH